MKYLLVLILTFSGIILQAQNQDIEIKVMSDSEPLVGAYVWINGNFIGDTDSLGIMCISDKSINLGDTISASFVGFDSDVFIYNKRRSSVKLDLKSQFTLDEVVVHGSKFNTRRYLKQSTKNCLVNHWRTTFSFDFELITSSDSILGRAVMAFSVAEFKPYIVSFECNENNKESSHYIASIFSIILKCSKFTFNHFLNQNYIVRYHGIEGNNKIFTYTHVTNIEKEQTLIKVDEKSRYIKQAEISSNNSNGNIVFIKTSYTNPNKYSYIDIQEASVQVKSQKNCILVKITNIDSKQYNQNTYQKYFHPIN